MRSRLFPLLAVAACNPQDPGASPERSTQSSTTSAVVGARITERSATARVLELLDAEGGVVSTYYPGFFNAAAIVPDPDSGEPSSRPVQGSWFMGVSFQASTGRAAVAVRGFVYAETSFDLVYLIDTRASGFGDDPYANGVFTYLPFDGRRNDGVLPSAGTATRPWLDIIPDGIAWDEAGRLRVTIADAAGSEAELAYGGDLTIDTCTWRFAGAAARCPDPTR